MQSIFTGPQRQAAILARMLRSGGIDAVMMFTDAPGQGSVFVPDTDADSPAIPRLIEQAEIEHESEGGTA